MRRRYDGGVNTTAETVRVGVLGPLAVTDAAGRPVRVGGQRVRALLAVLALAAGRPVPAHALIERLWPEPDDRPVNAVNALQSLVSRLRAALRQGGVAESVLESSPGGLPARGAAGGGGRCCLRGRRPGRRPRAGRR